MRRNKKKKKKTRKMFVQKEGKNIFIVRLKRSGDDQEQTIPFCVLPARHKMLFYKLTQTQTHRERAMR